MSSTSLIWILAMAALLAVAAGLGRFWWRRRTLLAERIVRLERLVAEQAQALEAQDGHRELLLAAMPDGIAITDALGRVVSANPAFRELLGASDEATETVATLAGVPPLVELVEQVASGGDRRRIEVELGAAGASRTCSFTGSPLSDRGGVLIVGRDISEQVRFEKRREDLVANVSHELKTPLTAIRGYAETLDEGALEDTDVARGFVGRILGQCRRLEALLRDLLTLSSFESPRSGARHEAIDLASMAARAVELVRQQATGKNVEITLQAPDEFPVLGNPRALASLLVNLLENAVKYNRPGGSVDVRIHRAGGTATIEVADTGIGIPAEAIPRLFERFFRVDSGRARQEGGTGLGLAIVKHAVQLHGGEIRVESRVGSGSTFRVTLPASEASAERAD